MKAIAAHNLTKRFGSFTAVDSISFEVDKGEIFGFLGANGAGKTTAMRMLCGLLIPTEPSIPLECALAPLEEETQNQDQHKSHRRNDGEEAQVLVSDRDREQEYHFHVKNQEDQTDQVILRAKLHPGIANSLDTRLVCFLFCRIGLFGPKQPR